MSDFSALKAGGPIAAVDPGDLRAVWEFVRKLRTPDDADPASSVGIDIRLLANVCAPGANVVAAAMRSILLDALARQGLLAAWQRGDRLDDVVLELAATFPIPRIEEFDPEAFVEQLPPPRRETP